MNNHRILQIIEILLRQEAYITIDAISKQIDVSNKTIRNDLKIVEELLLENGLHLDKKTGVGIQIVGEQSTKLKLSELIIQKNNELVEYSPQLRKIYIAMRLLDADEQYRIYELANELYVSRATIHKDIIEISELFAQYNVTIHRKNNHGLRIEGKERNKRKLLVELMTTDNGYQIFRNIANNENYPCDGSLVFAGLDINDDEVNEFIRLVMKSNNTYLEKLSFDTLVYLLLHIYITYLRVSQKHYVLLSDNFITELKDLPYFNEVQTITNTLEEYYSISFSETEIRYLQVFCISLKNSDFSNETDELETIEISNALIDSWSEQLHLPLKNDQKLFTALYAHLYPAITRFRHNISIENPLMFEIQDLYKNTYQIVQNSVSYINNKYNIKVSDEEIGYMTLHLVSSLDTFKEPLNTILVSSTGIGTNNLLLNKLMQQIPEIAIVSQESFLSIYEHSLENIDLILSTIDLHLNTTIPTLKIRPLLKDYDLLRLKDIIQKYYRSKNDPALRIYYNSK